jgi:hypothetical protein
MNKVNGFLLAVLLLFTQSLTSFAQKTDHEIKKMSGQADLILIGKVMRKKSDWNENKTRIYTRATIQVDEYLKGRADGKSVEVVYPGGEVGDTGELYTHMPVFGNNEEVLVFLKKDNKNKAFTVLNGEKGKIKIWKNTKSNDKTSGSNRPINDLKDKIKRFVKKP